MGFAPMNSGFADRRVRLLHHCANKLPLYFNQNPPLNQGYEYNLTNKNTSVKLLLLNNFRRIEPNTEFNQSSSKP